ncbi:MAG: DUF2190 family protein [Rhodospirillaceae bacterium]|nr:DUF2190 family protein [Rhodospirillaceae bacterium]
MGKVIADTATSQPLHTLTVEAEGAAEKFRRFVRADGTRCVANEDALGVCRVKSSTDGELIPVDTEGVVLVEAGAAINLAAEGRTKLQTDAMGRAITHAGANPIVGWALAAASAAGDIIPVLLRRD